MKNKTIGLIFIIIVNILLISLFLLLFDFLLYKSDSRNYLKDHPLSSDIPEFKYTLKYPCIPYTDTDKYFNGSDDIFQGRLPDGKEYENNSKYTPVVVFGDSFAHGQYLKYNQNFSYKLSRLLKRTVYNRAIPGAGVQHMYYQVSDKDAEKFYKDVPPADTVFYIMINDHYLRMSIFSDFEVSSTNFHLRYRIKNNKLVKDNYNNPLLNFFKSSYIIKFINLKYLNFVIGKRFMSERLTNKMLMFFTETKKILEQKWNKKINFIVILYDNNDIFYKKLLKQKLEDNGFTVIVISDLTNENLNSETYIMQDNGHPTEAAWDLLTPEIVYELKNKNIL